MIMKLVPVLLAFAGVIRCTLIEAPSHTAVRYGSDTVMKCTVSTQDQHLVYWQAHRVADSAYQQIYYSSIGARVPWVEPIAQSTYDLRIKNVNYTSSGSYRCDYHAAVEISNEAELLTMGEMNCGESGQIHIAGSNIPLVCSVSLTGALNPTLTWYVGNREIKAGNHTDQIPGAAHVPRKVEYIQVVTVDHTMAGEKFSCRLSFTKGTESNPQPPTYTDSCSITLKITESGGFMHNLYPYVFAVRYLTEVLDANQVLFYIPLFALSLFSFIYFTLVKGKEQQKTTAAWNANAVYGSNNIINNINVSN